MSERIGYLIPSGDFFVVHCPDCATNIDTPVYRENVAGYRQTCKACGRLLAGPTDSNWPELFNGKRRTPIIPDQPAQPTATDLLRDREDAARQAQDAYQQLMTVGHGCDPDLQRRSIQADDAARRAWQRYLDQRDQLLDDARAANTRHTDPGPSNDRVP